MLVFLQIASPTQGVHITQVDAGFLTAHKKVILFIGNVKVVCFDGTKVSVMLCYFVEGIIYLFLDTFQCQTEGVDTGFQAFQQVDGHQLSNTFLTTGH